MFYTITTFGFTFYAFEQYPPQISSPHPFLSALLSRSRASKTPSRPTKTKINFCTLDSPSLSFLSHKNSPHRCLRAKTSAIGMPFQAHALFSTHSSCNLEPRAHSKQSRKGNNHLAFPSTQAFILPFKNIPTTEVLSSDN